MGILNLGNHVLSLFIENIMNVQSLLAGQTVGGQQLTATNAYISCSSDNYKTTTDARVIDPNLKVGTSVYDACEYNWALIQNSSANAVSNSDAKPFVYYIPGNKDANGREIVVQAPRADTYNPRGPICNDNNLAQTTRQSLFGDAQP